MLDYFTPHDQASLDSGNHDLGVGRLAAVAGPAGGPRPRLMLRASKNGTLYLVNRDGSGRVRSQRRLSDRAVARQLFSSNFSAPVYYKGSVYLSGMSDRVKEFVLNNGLLTTPGASSQTAEVYGFPGAAMAISANGGSGGILWTIQRNGTGNPGVLRAYPAGNLNTLLYASTQAGSRDAMDFAVKFTVPLVANGKVYVGR